ARGLSSGGGEDEGGLGGTGAGPVPDAGVGAATGGHGGRARSRRAAGTSARCGRARAASWRRKWKATAANCDLRRRARRSLPAKEASRTRAGAHGRRRRAENRAAGGARSRESRTQRSLPLRHGQEIQEVPRTVGSVER